MHYDDRRFISFLSFESLFLDLEFYPILSVVSSLRVIVIDGTREGRTNHTRQNSRRRNGGKTKVAQRPKAAAHASGTW